MNAPAVLPRKETQTILLVWAIGATVAALVATSAAVWLFLQKRPAAVLPISAVSASPFLDLPENVIPGRYKWVSQSGNESFITLNADRSFVGKGGPNPAHRWELTRDSLVIFWLRSQNRLNKIERPGVYVEVQDGAEVARMEKQQE